MTQFLPFVIAALLMYVDPDAAGYPAPQSTDVIVMGDLETLSTESMDELGSDVQITAHLKINKVLEGKIAERSVTIRYIAHTEWPKRNKIRFRLRKSSDGTYLVCSSGGRGYVCD